MKKTMARSLALAFVGSLLVAGSAMAVPYDFSYAGGYTLSNVTGGISYDRITFDNPDLTFPTIGTIITPGSGYIDAFHPTTDSIFSDLFKEYVVIAPLNLNDGTLNFSPTMITDGFMVYDDNGDLLMKGDLEAISLNAVGAGGAINTAFSGNIWNITAGGTYTLGTSVIIDSFLSGSNPGGATTITLQIAGNLADGIINGNANDTGTYSGVAAPVPEPATMLLLGTGLVGLAGASRRKKATKA